MGLSEMLIIAAIALIFIGPKQLPGLAKALGRTIADLKKAMEDVKTNVTVNLREEETSFPEQPIAIKGDTEDPVDVTPYRGEHKEKKEEAVVNDDVTEPTIPLSKPVAKKDDPS